MFSVLKLSGKRLLKLVIYGYLGLMGLLFLQQGWMSLQKFLDKKIVEEVSVEQREEATLPPLTFCLIPGLRRAEMQFVTFEDLCPLNQTTNYKDCVDGLKYDVQDYLLATFVYPPEHKHYTADFGEWHETSFNFYTGSCFTFQSSTPRQLSQAKPDVITLNTTDNELSKGWALFVFVHNKDMFLPSISMAPNYAGQYSNTINPKPQVFFWLIVDVVLRHHINTKKKRCNDDPNYSIVQCMEQYVANRTGCASPWDIFPNDEFFTCQTHSDFSALLEAHYFINTMDPSRYISETGCLAPCRYEEYQVELKELYNPATTDIIDDAVETAIGISARTTNRKVVKDAFLYDINSLVGEVGGSLGLFLGISLVSLSDYLLSLLKKVAKRARLGRKETNVVTTTA